MGKWAEKQREPWHGKCQTGPSVLYSTGSTLGGGKPSKKKWWHGNWILTGCPSPGVVWELNINPLTHPKAAQGSPEIRWGTGVEIRSVCLGAGVKRYSSDNQDEECRHGCDIQELMQPWHKRAMCAELTASMGPPHPEERSLKEKLIHSRHPGFCICRLNF